MVGPVAIHFHAEGLPGSQHDYLQQARVEAFALVVLAQRLNDPPGQILHVVDFEALVVEAIEGIFDTPVALGLFEQLLERGQIVLERLQKRRALLVDTRIGVSHS